MIRRTVVESEYGVSGDAFTYRGRDYRANDDTILGALYWYWIGAKSKDSFADAIAEALQAQRIEEVR